MESRRIYQFSGEGQAVPVSESTDKLVATVAAPILAEGDLLGLVLFISPAPWQRPPATRSTSWPDHRRLPGPPYGELSPRGTPPGRFPARVFPNLFTHFLQFPPLQRPGGRGITGAREIHPGGRHAKT